MCYKTHLQYQLVFKEMYARKINQHLDAIFWLDMASIITWQGIEALLILTEKQTLEKHVIQLNQKVLGINKENQQIVKANYLPNLQALKL